MVPKTFAGKPSASKKHFTSYMGGAIRDASESQSGLNPNPVPHVDKLTEHNKPTPAKPAKTPLATAVVGTHI